MRELAEGPWLLKGSPRNAINVYVAPTSSTACRPERA
jgi:hypothetical protein